MQSIKNIGLVSTSNDAAVQIWEGSTSFLSLPNKRKEKVKKEREAIYKNAKADMH